MTPTDRRAALDRVERLAYWLDDRFRIPGTNIRFGLDGLIGLVPGAGDGLTSLASIWLVAQVRAMGVPRRLVARMCINIVIDFLIGLIPLLGDVFDIAFRANRRNLDLARAYFDRQETG